RQPEAAAKQWADGAAFEVLGLGIGELGIWNLGLGIGDWGKPFNFKSDSQTSNFLTLCASASIDSPAQEIRIHPSEISNPLLPLPLPPSRR
ncbi:MAG: hypothetical protein MUF62_07530, partial [Chitinophagaceae bacterium]|nr:hypothetical protein [Chitinophagaceae bacterium]